MQLQVKLQETEEIMYLKVKKQNSTYHICRFGSNKKSTVDI